VELAVAAVEVFEEDLAVAVIAKEGVVAGAAVEEALVVGAAGRVGVGAVARRKQNGYPSPNSVASSRTRRSRRSKKSIFSRLTLRSLRSWIGCSRILRTK